MYRLTIISTVILLVLLILSVVECNIKWIHNGVLWVVGVHQGCLVVIRNAEWPYATTAHGAWEQGGTVIGFPCVLLALFFAACPYLQWVRPLLKPKPKYFNPLECQSCGYNLIATPDGCPECGTPSLRATSAAPADQRPALSAGNTPERLNPNQEPSP